MDDLPYPFDRYPDHYSTWQHCVEEHRRALAEIAKLRNLLNAEHRFAKTAEIGDGADVPSRHP
jgi:hypothetical protein